MANDSWIVEGIYTSWCDPLIFGADLVVWLDPLWPIAVLRVVWRHIKSEVRGTNRSLGWKRLKNSLPSVCRCYTREPYDVQNHLDVMGFARSISEHYVADLRENLVRKSKLRA